MTGELGESSQTTGTEGATTVPKPNGKQSEFLSHALAADWVEAEKVLEQDANLLTAQFTLTGETVLHILASAARQRHVEFFNKLVAKVSPDDLELADNNGNTILHCAASGGIQEIVSSLVEKNDRLPGKANGKGAIPLLIAVLSEHHELASYLVDFVEFEPENASSACTILNTSIRNGLYGFALEMIIRFDILAVAKDEKKEGPLDVLAQMHSAFSGDEGRGQQGSWSRVFRTRKLMPPPAQLMQLLHASWETFETQRDLEKAEIVDLVNILFVAAENCNYVFLLNLLDRHPELLCVINASGHTIFHIAIKNRCEPIFSLIYEIGSLKSKVATYKGTDGSTMLHLAARLAPSSQLDLLPGAPLQMLRELQWYKEVEKIVPLSHRRMEDARGQRPQNLFMEEHKDLMKRTENWMKTSAKACMLLAILVARVIYTAAFTVPGGYDDKTGAPILVDHVYFMIFTLMEYIGMLSSCLSLLVFLCILTSCHAKWDFIELLPNWLPTGYATLVISLVSMVITYSMAFFISNRGHFGLTTILGVCALSMNGALFFLNLRHPLLTLAVDSLILSRLPFRSRGQLGRISMTDS